MNTMFWWVVLVTFVAGVGGMGLGGVVSAFIKRDSTKTVSLLLSFAGGVMLAVVCFDLVLEALKPPVNGEAVGLPVVLIGMIIGFAIVALLNYIIDQKTNPEIKHIDKNHPKTADDLDELYHSNHLEKHMEESSNLFVAGLIMAVAIALHNVPEGMVIGAMYVGVDPASLTSGSGFIMAVTIGLHNIPEGMSVAVPLIAGGMNRGKAVAITALSGFPTVLGAMLGYWAGSLGPVMNALALSFASGAMLYVVFGELLPESYLMWKSKAPALGIMGGLLLGMLLIL